MNPESSESENLFQSIQADANIDQVTVDSIEVAQFESEVVPTIEAVKMWSEGRRIDLRPRLVDSPLAKPAFLIH